MTVSLRRAAPPLAVAVLATVLAPAAHGAVQGDADRSRPQIIVGLDDDARTNPAIQPAGVVADQSLRKGDVIFGGLRADVLIGRQGPDVFQGGPGSDVIVGGTERGSDIAAFPPSDVADGGQGDDLFIWSPGDGSDAFTGDEPPRFTTVRRRGRTQRLRTPDDTDTLALGTLLLSATDIFQPALVRTGRGLLPQVSVSNRDLPPSLGTQPNGQPLPPIKGFCQIVGAPANSGYDHLVRFFVEATGVLAVTIRVREVERVLCPTRGSTTITLTTLGRDGSGSPTTRSTDYRPPTGSRLDAIVN